MKLRRDTVPNRGGRPRLKTLTELKRQQAALNIQNTRNGGRRSHCLKDLKELFKLRNLNEGAS